MKTHSLALACTASAEAMLAPCVVCAVGKYRQTALTGRGPPVVAADASGEHALPRHACQKRAEEGAQDTLRVGRADRAVTSRAQPKHGTSVATGAGMGAGKSANMSPAGSSGALPPAP